MAADPDPDPLSDPFGVATRDVRIRFRIRFGVTDRIRFRIRIRIRFQLKSKLTTAKVQQEYYKNNSSTENVCDLSVNQSVARFVLFSHSRVPCWYSWFKFFVVRHTGISLSLSLSHAYSQQFHF